MTQTCIDLYSGEYDVGFLKQYNLLKHSALEEYNHAHYYEKYCDLFDYVVKHHLYLEDHIYFREILYIQIQQLMDAVNVICSKYRTNHAKITYIEKMNEYMILLSPYFRELDSVRKCIICNETLKNFIDERNHMWAQHCCVQNSYTNHINKQKWLRRSPRVPKYIYKPQTAGD